jgi:hypothetical protein
VIPVVVGTSGDPVHLTTIGIPHRPNVLVVNRQFELAQLRAAVDRFDRFVFLKPSARILDSVFWEAVDSSGPAWLFARPSCYLAVYDSATLAPVLEQAPTVVDKETSIIWESRLHDLLPMPTIFPEVSDRNALRIDTIDGRPELVIGNALVIKHKGTVRCRRCPTWPTPGICPHIRARFTSSGTAKRTGTGRVGNMVASTSP